MRVCVYCASSQSIHSSYFDATVVLAKALVKHQIEVVYGGGAYGLMGQLADTILEEGGRIKGIMPQFMHEVEWAHKGISDLEFTQTLHERKARFLHNIDGIIALPGGSGTLEELLEAITLKRLGQFTQPIVILNLNGYYNPLQQMLTHCIDEQFMSPRHAEMWTFVTQPEAIIPALQTGPQWDTDALHFALQQ